MSKTHTIIRAIDDGRAAVSKSTAVSAGSEVNVDESVPGASTNLEVAYAVAQANVKSLVMLCDRDITICTNDVSGGSPQETIALKAGTPLQWVSADGYFTCPFAGDVTGLFVTLAAGTAATLQIWTTVDPT